MKISLFISVALLTAGSLMADHDKAQSDEKFVRKVAMGSKMEVEMGQMAVKNASDPQVKQFGQRLVDDHSKAGQELKQIAQSKGISTDDMKDEKSHRTDSQASAKSEGKQNAGEKMHKLQGLTGSQFDEEFIKCALKHHRKDVAEFQKASQQLQDPQLKAFASKTLPVLQQHLQTAQQLAQSRNIQESAGAETDPASPQGATINDPAGASTETRTTTGQEENSNRTESSQTINSNNQERQDSANQSSSQTDSSLDSSQPQSSASSQTGNIINEPAGASTSSSQQGTTAEERQRILDQYP